MDKFEFLANRLQVRTDFKNILWQRLPLDSRDGAWTPVEAFHHVLRTNQSSQALLARLFGKAKDLPVTPNDVWPVRAELQNFPRSEAFSIKAFPGTEPDLNASMQSLEALEASLENDLGELLDLSVRFRLETLSFPHPLAGRLNFYEWLVFGVVHEKMHLDQVLLDL